MEWFLALKEFNNQWAFAVGALTLLWCFFWVRPRFGIFAASLLTYCAFSAIWVWIYVNNRYLPMDAYNQTGLKYSVADSFAKLFMVLVPMMALSKSHFRMRMLGEMAAFFFVTINSAIILISYALGCWKETNACGGLIGNPSIGVGFMMCTLPVFIHSWRKQKITLALAGLAAFASHSSVAVGLFAVYSTLWLVPWEAIKENISLWILKAGALFLGLMGAARYAFGEELLRDSDRFKVWAMMMKLWSAPANLLFGTGLGSYHVFSINLQVYGQKNLDPSLGTNFWWNSMHNEPLEFLFVGGFVGLFLFVATYLTALYRAYCFDIRIALSVLLYGLYMLVNPALHNPLPALFGAWLFVYALRQPKTLEETL